jgi:L-alanine-DL-glutamate epimerase-like enolase superfamily enzyme
MNRRSFVRDAGLLAAYTAAGFPKIAFANEPALKTIQVVKAASDFEREKLVRPFGFKGGYLTELWQIASKLESTSVKDAIGLATQSVLYGDAALFASRSESEGNALMYLLVSEVLQLVKKYSFTNPVELIEKIMPEGIAKGKQLTGKADLNINFIYNALVSVDNAAWLLYAKENNFNSFDAMIPAAYRPALSNHSDKIAIMYQVPYGMPMEDLRAAAKQGYFVIKIKTGYPGTQAEMLTGDMERLTQIHNAIKDVRTTHTPNGKLIYTMDANARYEKKETLLRYLDHAKKIGAFDQILLYEEPLNEANDESVNDVGIRIAGDESVHDEAAAIRRLDQGYTAIVLKGIAKTLSVSMKLAKLAHERNVPCICADLTVNPILIDWHKNLAARVAPFPGIGMGMMETNGDMNYRNWNQMLSYHPSNGASWMKSTNGVFELNKDFYQRSGGIFETSPHYTSMFQAG